MWRIATLIYRPTDSQGSEHQPRYFTASVCMWLIHVWHDTWIYVAWLIDICDVTHSQGVEHQPRYLHGECVCMCDMTHWYVWHGSLTHVTWLIRREWNTSRAIFVATGALLQLLLVQNAMVRAIIYVDINMYMHICTYYLYIYIYNIRICVYIYIYVIYEYVYIAHDLGSLLRLLLAPNAIVCAFIHVNMNMYIHIYKYIYICTYMCVK